MTTLESVSEYRAVFLLGFLFVLFLILVLILIEIVKRAKALYEDSKSDITKEELLEMSFEEIAEEEKGGALRRLIAPDGINPGPDDHLIIYDAVKKMYARSLTISRLPKNVRFANTFAPLFNFPDSTYSVFVEPISEQDMSKKLDKHITLLEAETIAAEGDPNRIRKLNTQFNETNTWAREIESGKNKFYRLGWVFTLYGNSLEDLTKKSDQFRNLARNRNMDVTTCVCVQSEAYLANMPYNRYTNGTSMVNANDGIFYHYMDKYAASTIFNYTSSTYSHRDGIPLGRDRNTGKPVIFDFYHPSFNGMTHCVVGKTGTGKSATLKIASYRNALRGYRFASLDVQPRQGTGDGEYAGICELLHGLNFELKSDSNNCLNIFEIIPTTRFEKTGIGRGFETLTLELNMTIAQASNLILIMIAENGSADSMKDSVLLNNIIKDTIEKMYASFGIVDGDPNSLYYFSKTADGSQIRKEKPLPTINDFYKILLTDQAREKDEDKKSMRKIVLLAMEDYVKDLYFTESLHFFTKEQYDALPVKEGTDFHLFTGKDGKTEVVRHIHGTRGYFDGQSTLKYSNDIPWINIDCSQMDEASKIVAMSVGMNYINERIIKGNSANRDKSNKVMAIFDEAHMVFKIKAARSLLDEIVRTARKRNVALAICTQTLREFAEYPETEGIRKNAASCFVFKQDYGDRAFLLEKLGITESQVDAILEQGGNLDQYTSEDTQEAVELEKAKHRGEVTIVINKTVIPLKVDYRKVTEKYAVETAASEIISHIERSVS